MDSGYPPVQWTVSETESGDGTQSVPVETKSDKDKQSDTERIYVGRLVFINRESGLAVVLCCGSLNPYEVPSEPYFVRDVPVGKLTFK